MNYSLHVLIKNIRPILSPFSFPMALRSWKNYIFILDLKMILSYKASPSSIPKNISKEIKRP